MRFAIFILALFAPFIANAHSWVEQLSVIDENGNFTGNPGYIRGYFPRGEGFNDDRNTARFPESNNEGITRITPDLSLCKETQRQPNSNAPDFPVLVAQPGNLVALKYLENGHVTQPWNQKGKPAGGGLVYVYATTNPKPDQKLMDVLAWSTNGTLDSGKLFTIQNFDDGRCHQLSASNISVSRTEQIPNPVPGQPGSVSEVWCETDIKIPDDTPPGLLTVYWVWQWPTLPNVDEGLPVGKDEIYTSCMDIQVVGDRGSIKAVGEPKPLLVQDGRELAHPDFASRANKATFPTIKSFYGPDNTLGEGGGQAKQPPPAPPVQAANEAPTGSQAQAEAPVGVTTSTLSTVTTVVTVTVTDSCSPTVTPARSPANDPDPADITTVPARHRHRRFLGRRHS